MGNSTQQNDANGGTPLAEPTGSHDIDMRDYSITLNYCDQCGSELRHGYIKHGSARLCFICANT